MTVLVVESEATLTLTVSPEVTPIEVTLSPTGTQGPAGPASTVPGPAGAAGPNQVTTSTSSNITGILKGNGSTVAQATQGTDYEAPISATTTADYYRGDKTFQPLNKTTVGLANVPNTDATLRSNHTGTQPAATITGLATVATTGAYADLTGRPGASLTRTVTTISTSQTLASAGGDYVYFVTGTTTATLPTAVANTNRYSITNSGSNTVTVATTSAQTMNGVTSLTLLPDMSLDFVSDGSNWRIF